jgi:Uma2 family endonuclease
MVENPPLNLLFGTKPPNWAKPLAPQPYSNCLKVASDRPTSPGSKIFRWNALTPEQRQKFPPIAPDFVIELRSETDSLSELQAKMREYQDNGVHLGWLINPKGRTVEIYRLGQNAEILPSPNSLDGEDVLPGFTLNLSKIW